LLAALQSPNAEIRERAAKLVDTIRRRARDRVQLPGAIAADRGAVDLFVAGTASWELPASSERLWEPSFKLTRAIAERAGWKWPGYLNKGMTDFQSYVTIRDPRFVRTSDPYHRKEQNYKGKMTTYYPEAVIGSELTTRGALGNLSVIQGSVQIEKSLLGSIIFANGTATVGVSVEYSVLVCDGDVTVDGEINSSIVIARGSIKAKSVMFSTLIAGKAVITAPEAKLQAIENRIVENDSNPLGFVTFFELSALGVAGKAVDGGVQLTSVADGKPFAKVGAKVGDVVTAVGGKKPDSPEALRRLLRDALAIGDAAVQLRRGNETVTVKVSLPE
jgi:hypothetical protein